MNTFITILVSALTGIIGAGLTWIVGVFVRKPLDRFYELRLEAHRMIFDVANLLPGVEQQRSEKAQADLRKIAAEIDALRAVLPTIVLWLLQEWRGYNLARATAGLTGLSNSFGTSDGSKTFHRVTAQRGLRLPVDPVDLEVFERRKRVEEATL
jgi:hypothetical protein